MNRRTTVLLLGLGLGVACGKDSAAPLVVATVELSSPIGPRLAVGRDVQLAAVARTASGQLVPDATFIWRATGTAVQVDDGRVTGLAGGESTIAATADEVTGEISLTVIAADLPAITATTNDALAVALVGALTAPVATQVNAAIAQCGAGVTAGNFDTIDACLAALRAQAAAATDPTDQVLLATLGVFVDYIEGLVTP